MRYAKVRKQDISNGPGFRVSIFTQGCSHHCYNCFNQETWNFNNGYEWNDSKKEKILDLCNYDFIEGLSILGGDPFCLLSKKNFDTTRDIITLCKEFKERYPNKTIWAWTGYTFEELFDESIMNVEDVKEILQYIDVVVDGLFIESKKVLNLKWRGSTNQRFIDVKSTLKTKTIQLINV